MKESYSELHRELWLWLSNNQYNEKRDWPRWKGNDGDIDYVQSFCFACAATIDRFGDDINCIMCPLDFIHKCDESYSYYEKWRKAEYPSHKRHWALKIANTIWAEKGEE